MSDELETDRAPGKPTISQLIEKVTDQITRLIRAEIELIKAEMSGKVKQLSGGAALFVAAAGLGFFALAVLTFVLIAALHTWLWWWVAGAVVFVLYLVLAGILVMVGQRMMKKSQPMQPVQATEQLKADVETIKNGLRP